MCILCVIFQEQLKIEVKLLLSANRKSFMPRRLAQQRMTLSNPEWPFHRSSSASRAISAEAELLVSIAIYHVTRLRNGDNQEDVQPWLLLMS